MNRIKLNSLFAAVLLCVLLKPVQASTTAQDLVLIVNKQSPESRPLAEAYAAARGVPDGRIIEVDVPEIEDIDREFYEKSIADPVRAEIESRQLRDKAKCLVLFYGMPLRIREKNATPFERNEVDAILDPMIATLQKQLRTSAEKLEAIAKSIDPAFHPPEGLDTSDQIRDRLLAANRACEAGIRKVADPKRQLELTREMRAAQTATVTMPPLPGMATTKPQTMPTQKEVNDWMANATDPAARQQIRQTMYFAGNVFQLLTAVEIQKRSLTVKESEASVDSELSCVFLGNYDKTRWMINAYHHSGVGASLKGKMIRTARIDGPTIDIARRTFENSIRVEKEGLKGDVVLDARGLSGKGDIGTYDYFDQSIRNVAKFTGGVKDLNTVFDNNSPLLPNGSSSNAAMYCGWYQLRNYSPTVKLIPGSIAYHVASSELITLRSPIEKGWCRGLMLDGADATVGPVGEPYLMAFPPADHFFGLLFTGKTTLVDAYWASIPVTSWKMILIGDPLYRPFAVNPVISTDRLPESVRKSLD